MYEHFEHTADLGLRVRANSLEELFADAAIGLTAMIVTDVGTIRPTHPTEFTIQGQERDLLLFDWLSELLFAYETKGMLYSQFQVQFNDQGLTATARGEPVEPDRHPLDHEVKAITYHGLKVEHTGGEWMAEVIVDI